MSWRAARAIVIVLTIAAIHPLLSHDFTTWDDPHNVTANPHVHPPSLSGLKFHWTNSWRELYVPITYTTWIALAAPSGETPNPWLFHGANVLIHLVAAMFSLRVLKRLGFAPIAACAGALVFSVHPVQVESVGWVSGLKDVLAGALCLVAIDQYLAAIRITLEDGREEGLDAKRYAFAITAFVLAQLAKPSAVALPIVLLVIDRMFLRRSMRHTIRTIGPLIIIAIPFLIVGVRAQPPSIVEPIPLWWRPFIAGHALAFYLWKLIWPLNLGIDYGQRPWQVMRSAVGFTAWIAPAAIAIFFAIFWKRGARTPLLAMAIFVAALLPMLGLQPFEFQHKSTTADHYLYLPMLGVAIGIAGLVRVSDRRTHAILAIGIALLAIRSFDQTRHWRDSESLYRRAVAVNPRSLAALQNLIVVEMDRSDGRAMEQLARQMIRVDPNSPDGPVHLGMALAFQNRFVEAHGILNESVGRFPDHLAGRMALAAVLIDLDRPSDALAEYDRVAEIDPTVPNLEPLRTRAARLAQQSMTSPATRPTTQP